MDPLSLVEGGAEGLVRIAAAFGSKGLEIVGIYLIKTSGYDDEERWTIRLVSKEKSPHTKRNMLVALSDLRRAQVLPLVDKSVRFDIVHVEDPEASRIIDYTQRLGGAPAIIRDVMWQGLFVEYALVALVPERDAAAA